MGEKEKVETVKAEVKAEAKNNKKGLIIGCTVAAVVVVAIVVALVILISNGIIGGKNIAGKYELVGMKDGETEYTKENIQMLKAFGVNVTLELKEDKTGTIDVYGQKMDLTYNNKTMTYNNESVPYTVDNNTITLENEDSKMTFEKIVEDETTNIVDPAEGMLQDTNDGIAE